MEDFIMSMEIFKKYSGNAAHPFHCEHDIMYFCAINNISKISKEDLIALEDLGWNIYPDEDEISSFRYGSC